MFSVFGRSGLLFSGSMEALGQVEPIAALARSRRLGHSGAQAFRDALTELPAPHSEPRATPSDTLHRVAIAAYAQANQTELARHPLTRVVDIMSRNVVSLPDAITLETAWDVLTTRGIGQAPVLNVQGQLVGLFLRVELLRPERLPDAHAHLLAWKALLMQPLETAMLSPVPAVSPATDIRRLARVLLDTGLPGLPVSEDDGRLVGFVTRSDLLRAVVSDPPLDLWS